MYNPAVDDYVKWNNIEGWVYFADSAYITIEISVRDSIRMIWFTLPNTRSIIVVLYAPIGIGMS